MRWAGRVSPGESGVGAAGNGTGESAEDSAARRYRVATAAAKQAEQDAETAHGRRGAALVELSELGLSVPEIAERVGLSQSGVRSAMRGVLGTGPLLEEGLRILARCDGISPDLAPRLAKGLGYDRTVVARRVLLGSRNLDPSWPQRADPGELATLREAAGRAAEVLAEPSDHARVLGIAP